MNHVPRPARRRRSTRRRHRHARRAFTLMEVIIAVTIVALLATLVVPRLWKTFGRAQVSTASSQGSAIASQLSTYLLEHNMVRPPDDLDLAVLAEGDDPYLKREDLIDPWGNPYVLIVPGEYNYDFDVVSYGADGEPGGEGPDADIPHGSRD